MTAAETAVDLGGVRGQIAGVQSPPCAACPWRLDNHGRAHLSRFDKIVGRP
jgi:hypothetical protein